MANLPQQDTINQYQADGVTTIYNYAFLILEDEDIAVYVTPSGQTPVPATDIKILNVDYTVQNAGELNGGTITFLVAPPISSTVTFSRDIQISIDTDFSLAQNFNGANLDNAFERVTLFCQQINSKLNERVLQYIINTYLPNATSNLIPSLGNGQVWTGQNGAVVATYIENNPDISLLRSQLESESPLADGSTIVGYYNPVAGSGSTLSKYLNSESVFGFDSGIADQMILSISNSDFDYMNGQVIQIVPAFSNLTTTPTINVNSKGSKLIKRNPVSAAQAGDITQGNVTSLTFDHAGNCFYITNIFALVTNPAAPTNQQFTSGSGTYNTPVGCSVIRVRGVGPGGGGGGCATASSTYASAGGGGGGGYFEITISNPDPTYSYSIGTGGAGGAAGNNPGSTGTPTTFGTLTANSGTGGAGAPASGSGNVRQGGDGGTASGGQLNINGDCGGTGVSIPSGSLAVGGNGGASKLGSSVVGGLNLAGNNGNNYGSGGSGASKYNVGGAHAGGNGSDGFITIDEFYN